MRSKNFALFVAVLMAVVSVNSQANAHDVLTVETRPGVTVDVDIFEAKDPKGVLVLLEGGPGKAEPGGHGFMNSSYSLFVDSGYTVALMGVPSDRSRLGGKFRTSEKHLQDMDMVVKSLKQRMSDLPVWMAGISASTRSVAHYAVNRSKNINGIILMASGTKRKKNRPPIAESSLEKITVPILAISHKDDGCALTLPEGAQQIVKAAVNSKAAVAKYFEGGYDEGGNPCRPGSHHTFTGIEKSVVSEIVAFIGKHSK